MKKEFIERVKMAIAPVKLQLDEAQELVFSDDGQADLDGVELLNRFSALQNAWHAVNNYLIVKGRT
jgi:hypothetical protein